MLMARLCHEQISSGMLPVSSHIGSWLVIDCRIQRIRRRSTHDRYGDCPDSLYGLSAYYRGGSACVDQRRVSEDMDDGWSPASEERMMGHE